MTSPCKVAFRTTGHVLQFASTLSGLPNYDRYSVTLCALANAVVGLHPFDEMIRGTRGAFLVEATMRAGHFVSSSSVLFSSRLCFSAGRSTNRNTIGTAYWLATCSAIPALMFRPRSENITSVVEQVVIFCGDISTLAREHHSAVFAFPSRYTEFDPDDLENDGVKACFSV